MRSVSCHRRTWRRRAIVYGLVQWFAHHSYCANGRRGNYAADAVFNQTMLCTVGRNNGLRMSGIKLSLLLHQYIYRHVSLQNSLTYEHKANAKVKDLKMCPRGPSRPRTCPPGLHHWQLYVSSDHLTFPLSVTPCLLLWPFCDHMIVMTVHVYARGYDTSDAVLIMSVVVCTHPVLVYSGLLWLTMTWLLQLTALIIRWQFVCRRRNMSIKSLEGRRS